MKIRHRKHRIPRPVKTRLCVRTPMLDYEPECIDLWTQGAPSTEAIAAASRALVQRMLAKCESAA